MIGLPAYYTNLQGESLQLIDVDDVRVDACLKAHRLACERYLSEFAALTMFSTVP